MAKEFIILAISKPELVITMRNLFNSNATKHTFESYEEAIAFAETLDYGVTIYEAIAKTNIKHEINKYDENTDDFTRKQVKIS